MKTMIYILTALSVIALAFWAYRENYTTQASLNESQRLRAEISEARARLSVLRAEWAYLNRPDRLRDLAEVNFDRLGLLPLRPDQFGRIDEIAYPSPVADDALLPITDPVDVRSMQPQEDRP